MIVLYLTRDLFFSSRVVSLARAAQIDVIVCSQIGLVEPRIGESGVGAVLLDLEHPEADPEQIMKRVQGLNPRPRIVAYGPHVKEDLLQAAQGVGCDAVMSRGQFDKQILPYLQALLASNP